MMDERPFQTREPDPGGAPDLRVQSLRAWADALPLADAGETARRLYALLARANREPLPWHERLRLLAAVARPLERVAEQLEGRLREADLPLTERTLRMARQCRELEQAAAENYFRVAVEVGRLPEPARQPLAVALIGTLRYLGRALLTGYQARLPAAPELWRMLHHSHTTAGRNRLTAYAPAGGGLDLLTVYKRTLLFAASDPHRLRPQEATGLYRLLGRHAAAAALRPCSAGVPETGPIYVIDPGGDGPPLPVGCCATLAGELLLLDLAPLTASFERQGERLDPLLAAARERWHAGARARPLREPGEGGIELLPGLSRIHAQLCHDSRDGSELAALFAPARFSALPGGTLARRRNDPFVRLMSEATLLNEPPPAEPEPPPPWSDRWSVLDAAPRGLRIAHPLPGAGEYGLKTGELVAVRCTATSGPRLALVRWLRGEGDRIEAGLKVLAGRPLPAAARRPGGPWQRVVLLTDTGNGEQLLAPARLFTADEPLRIFSAGGEQDLRIGAPLEETAACVRLALRREAGAEALPGEDLADRFGLLWTGL